MSQISLPEGSRAKVKRMGDVFTCENRHVDSKVWTVKRDLNVCDSYVSIKTKEPHINWSHPRMIRITKCCSRKVNCHHRVSSKVQSSISKYFLSL